MRKTFYLLNEDKLLADESWLWFSANEKRKDSEQHDLYIELQEIDAPSGEIKSLMEMMENWMIDYGDSFYEIQIEKIHFNRGCGDYQDKYYLVGKRKETIEERDLRLSKLKAAEDKVTQAKAEEEKLKEKKEYEKFLKLKEKFGEK